MAKKMGVGRRKAARAHKPVGKYGNRAPQLRHNICVVSSADIAGAVAAAATATTPVGPASPALPRRAVLPAAPSQFRDVVGSNPNPLTAGLYKRGQRILLVGEGDFSFSLALATVVGGDHIVATSFDSHTDVLGKYR